MENRFNNNDFEHFVKQNADQYRMFPSDKVWKGIHNTLHTRRRWYGIGLALLLLTTGVVTWVMLTPSGKNRQVVTTLPKVILSQQPVAANKQQPAEIVIAPSRVTTNKTPFIVPADNLRHDLLIDNKDDISGDDNYNNIDPIAANTEANPVVAFNDQAPVVRVEPEHQPESILTNTQPAKLLAYNKPANNPSVKASTPSIAVKQHPAVNNYSFASTLPIENKKTAEPEAEKKDEKVSLKNDMYPFSIESVINSYKFMPKRKKVSLEVYFTPSISYRDLKENKPYIDYARNTVGVPTAYYTVDINSVVTHKPDLGLQLGFTAGYPLSKKVKVIGGLQFNVSKYDIKAYNHPSEVATITLSTAAGGSRTVSSVTNYRNAGGSSTNWLHNLYFSVSTPIGLELKLTGNRKAYMGISGTVQPTYMISNRSYLISTDYKNYTEIPSLTRKFNINTGFEIFAGSSVGKLKWRVGPQIRYQAMSSFDKKYPIQEHLFDFGLKLGIMLNK